MVPSPEHNPLPADPVAECCTARIATVAADGTIEQLVPAWVPPGATPTCLRELVTKPGHGAVETALAQARDDGHAVFNATLATGGLELTFRLTRSADGLCVSATPEHPGPLASRAMADRADVGITLLNADGEYLYVNDAYCRIYGYPVEELLGRHFSIMFRNAEQAPQLAHHQAILQRCAEGQPREVQVLRRDGTPILVDSRSQCIEMADGTLTRLATVQDITAFRDTERRLAEAEAALRDLTDRMPGAIYRLHRSPNGHYYMAHMSEGFRELAGIGVDAEIADLNMIVAMLPKEYAERALADAEASVESGQPFELVFPLDSVAGRRWIHARSQPHRHPDGTVVWNGLMFDITERRDAQAEAERLNAILESTPDCVVVTEPDGTIRYMNSGGRTLLGLAGEEDMSGRSFLEFLPPAERAFVRDEASAEAAANGSWSGETTLVVTDGRRLRVSQTILCHREPSGRVDRFSTVIRDLSERMTIEAHLRASEKTYRALYHSTPTLLHSINANGCLIEVSDYWLEQLGYTRAQVLGVPSTDFFAPDTRQHILNQVRPAFWREGYCRDIPVQIICADGSLRDVLLSSDCEYEDDGRVRQAVSVMTDVTERLAAERELSASETRYRALYDNTPVMLHSVDHDQRIVNVNDFWLQHLGYQRDEVLGARVQDFMTPASAEKAQRIDLPRLHETGALHDEPMEIIRADGEVRNILLTATAEYDEGRMQLSRAAMIDVSEQRQAEANYRDIFEHASEGIYRSTPEGRLLRANPALARLHGFDSEAELLGHLGDIHNDWYADRESRPRLIEAIKRDDSVHGFQAQVICRATGERIWTSENVRAIRDSHGQIRYLEGTVRDISNEYRNARLAEDRGEILKRIARDEPLTGILYEIVGLIEQQYASLTAAILRLQNGVLYSAAAPALSIDCIQAIDGQTPARIGSAIALALERDRAAVEICPDTDATSEFRSAVDAVGYRAIMAVPIHDQQDATLGVLVAFGNSPQEIEGTSTLLVELSQITSIAIEQNRLTRKLLHQAQYDALTELPNRTLLNDRLKQGIREAERGGYELGLLLLDLDEFKLVNDTLGHSAGDQLLKLVATNLRATLRAGDTVARLGGDEFVIVAPLRGDANSTELAERILETLQPGLRVAEREVSARPSIGISVYPQDGASSENLLQAADSAMYAAKHAGKNCYRYFAETMNEQASERLQLESELRSALTGDELVLYFQPLIMLAERTLDGAEALLRWQHPTRGLLTPGQFLPAAERSGLINEIDQHVIQMAARVLAKWQASGRATPLAVNVSAQALHADDFGARVAQILFDAEADPSGFELEITESTLLQDIEHANRQLNNLKTLAPGLRVAIDDFGSGYSSLNYLRHLPIDTLKIDRAFVTDIVHQDDTNTARAIVRTVVELGRSLGLNVIAEGVESAAQADLMQELACHCAQGYWFDEPMTRADFERRLQRG